MCGRRVSRARATATEGCEIMLNDNKNENENKGTKVGFRAGYTCAWIFLRECWPRGCFVLSTVALRC